jgi:hypothetical protein
MVRAAASTATRKRALLPVLLRMFSPVSGCSYSDTRPASLPSHLARASAPRRDPPLDMHSPNWVPELREARLPAYQCLAKGLSKPEFQRCFGRPAAFAFGRGKSAAVSDRRARLREFRRPRPRRHLGRSRDRDVRTPVAAPLRLARYRTVQRCGPAPRPRRPRVARRQLTDERIEASTEAAV